MQPPPEPRQTAREWLTRAERDLQATRSLVAAAPPLTDIAVYHAQQAAEKALKGFILQHGRPVLRVHDLAALLAECIAIDARFGQLLNAAQMLTPYAVRFRYPDPSNPLAPPLAEAEAALRLAEDVVSFVRGRLGA